MQHIETRAITNARLLLWGAGIFLLAIVLRVIFYTGFFGSDEVTYTQSAFRILQGDWTVSSYAGANRYGINLPVAAFMSIFGVSEYSANLWSFICSVLEVAAILVLGTRLLGYKAAFLGALILAVLPIHVHLAGRLMADSPLALFITLSFLLFWLGENNINRRSILFLLAGISAGIVYWIKPPVAVVYLLLFLSYPIIFRRWSQSWLWMITGFSLIVFAHTMFFWWATGNPIYIIEKMLNTSSIDKLIENTGQNTENYFYASYYLTYLFIKIWHTWLLGPFAIIALSLIVWNRKALSIVEKERIFFLLWWGIGLLAAFSLFIISFDPLTFLMKQTNYMLIFIAPLCLLSGYGLSLLSRKHLNLALLLFAIPSLALAGMEQRLIHIHTANSKATYDFALAHSDANFFVGTNAMMYQAFRNVTGNLDQRRMTSIDALASGKFAGLDINDYVIYDTQTFRKTDRNIIGNLLNNQSLCLIKQGNLKSTDINMQRLMKTVTSVFAILPKPISSTIISKAESILQTKPAIVYLASPLDACQAVKQDRET